MHRTPLFVFLLAVALSLSACSTVPATKTDYRIKVIPTADGGAMVIPPECPVWTDEEVGDFENQPFIQFGCATARNLAVMVEDPKDLLEGRSSDVADGIAGAATVERYRADKTKALTDPQRQSGSGS